MLGINKIYKDIINILKDSHPQGLEISKYLSEFEQVHGNILKLSQELLETRVKLRILDGLSDEQGQAFADFIGREGVTDTEIRAWLQHHIPNFDAIVQEEAEQVKREYLSE